MNTVKPVDYDVIPFQRNYNHISPKDLEEILESLEDMGYLSEQGKIFRTRFWEMFIVMPKGSGDAGSGGAGGSGGVGGAGGSGGVGGAGGSGGVGGAGGSGGVGGAG